MRAILVDDEPIMLRSFMRNSADIPELNDIVNNDLHFFLEHIGTYAAVR